MKNTYEINFKEESKKRLSMIISLLCIIGRKIAATSETGIVIRQKILKSTKIYSYYVRSIEKEFWDEAIQYPYLREILKRINKSNEIIHEMYILLLQYLDQVKKELAF